MSETPLDLSHAPVRSDQATARRAPRANPRAIIAGVVFAAIIGLAVWYLVRPEPLLVQGEVESMI